MPVHMDKFGWQVYNVYLTIIQYFIPLIVVDAAYMVIAYRVWVIEPSGDQRFMKDRRKVCWFDFGKRLLNGFDFEIANERQMSQCFEKNHNCLEKLYTFT